MTFDEAIDACAAHPAVELDYPFGSGTPVFKVVGKVFAIVGIAGITLKADPEDARALVATFPEVTPGYHMNKRHWVSVGLPSGQVPLAELIRESYDLVVASLPRDKRPVGGS